MNTDTITSWLNAATENCTQENLHRLKADLGSRVSLAKFRYAWANARINANMQTRSLPECGRRKLNLSLPELVRHEEAKKERSRSQHQLHVLVPMHRLVRVILEQQSGNASVTPWPVNRIPSFALAVIERNLGTYGALFEQIGKAPSGAIERQTMTEVMAANPGIFPKYTDAAASVTKQRQALFDKIRASVTLDEGEASMLKEALRV